MRQVLLSAVVMAGGLLLLTDDSNPACAKGGGGGGGSKGRPTNQHVVNKHTDLTISLAPEEHNGKPLLHIRILKPAEYSSFDEKGNPKPLSGTEKQKAKGTASEQSMPGYHGTTSDIKVGDVVTVSKFVTEKTDSKGKTTYTPDGSLSPVSGTVQSINKDKIVVRILTPTVQSNNAYRSNPNGNRNNQAGHANLPKEKLATMVVQNSTSDKSSQPDKKNNNKDKANTN